jgi:outer membrane protein assembly factor BamB
MPGVRSDGSLVCPTCNGLLMLDPDLHLIRRAGPPSISRIAIAPDDSMYALAIGAGTDAQLFALSPAGEVRWKAPIAYALEFPTIAVGAEGAYVEVAVPAAGGSTPGSVEIDAFDATTGDRHTLVANQGLLGAAPGGGVFTVEHQGSQSVTLHQVGPAGTPVWSRALTAVAGSIELRGAAARTDGGAVVFGFSAAAVDFGDRTLALQGQSTFVAGFDPTGATRWAFEVPLHVDYVVPTQQDELLLAWTPGGATHDTDAMFAVATPAGVSRTLTVAGPGHQRALGLAVTPDGLAWLQISSVEDPGIKQAPVIRVGDRMFDPGTYLFKLVP